MLKEQPSKEIQKGCHIGRYFSNKLSKATLKFAFILPLYKVILNGIYFGKLFSATLLAQDIESCRNACRIGYYNTISPKMYILLESIISLKTINKVNI